ncbi:MAG: HIT domain-containing protein [Gammaproteobacteria bacterium]
MFELHPQLQQDTEVLGHFSLCQLLLMQDAQYPWFILVPMRDAIQEVYQLSDDDQQQLWRESAHLAEGLMQAFAADKMNIAALGNVVPQLHIHHIVRYRTDASWPAPVWGKLPAIPYSATEHAALLQKLRALPVLQHGFHWQA